MRWSGLVVLAALLATAAASCAEPMAAAGGTAGSGSITDRTWTDEHGAPVRLSTWRGTPLVVTMIYRSCREKCPITLAKLRRIEQTFHDAAQPVAFVLVTLDPQSDTPPRLAAFKQAEHLDDASWHLLNGDDASTRELNRFLRVRAFKDDTHIDHDVKIAIFDRAGRLTRSFEGWDFSEGDVLRAAKR